MTRNDINKKSIKLAKENKILALEFATGIGKSKIKKPPVLNFK